MTEPPPQRRSHRSEPDATPLWVKAFIVLVVLVAVAFAATLILGLQHGPGMHGLAPVAVR
jgi:hypothetical protein